MPDLPVLQMLPVDQLAVDPVNPRPAAGDVSELVASIIDIGVLNPLIVRPAPAGGWGILSGQRRWTAAQQAGLAEVPCLVRDGLDDDGAFAVAVAENLGRKAMSPLETAAALRAMLDKGMTGAQVGARVGLSTATVSLYQRLVDLPEHVQAKVEAGELGVRDAIDRHGRRYRRSNKPRGRSAPRERGAECTHTCPTGHDLVALPTAALERVAAAGRSVGLSRDLMARRILEAYARALNDGDQSAISKLNRRGAA